MKNNKLRNGILIGAVVLLALIAGTSAVTIVPAGHTGVIVTMGKVSDRVLSEGMHLKVPFAQQIVMMNNKIQKTEIDSNGVSKDLQTVSSGVAINYHINKDDSAKIYQSIGEGYADTVLQPAIQESMKAITAQYTAEELITKRSAVGEEIGATLAEKVQEYGILIDKFNIINFDFSEEFNAAIEQKQVAEQNKLRAETEKEQKVIEAQADAEQKVIAAKAEADAIRQKAEAEAEANEKINASLNENVLKYQQIEKWNGEYPNVVSSDSSILVTLLPAEPLRHSRQKTRENNGSGRASLLCRFCIDRREEHEVAGSVRQKRHTGRKTGCPPAAAAGFPTVHRAVRPAASLRQPSDTDRPRGGVRLRHFRDRNQELSRHHFRQHLERVLGAGVSRQAV